MLNPLSWFKIAGLLGLVAAVIVGISYVKITNNKIADLSSMNATLTIQVAEYEEAVKELRKNFELQKNVLTNLYTDMLLAGIPEAQIRNFFLNTNIDEIAVADPEKAQELINKQQEDINRCFELLSGEPKLPNEGVNPICPNL
jgi:hypothetical protein